MLFRSAVIVELKVATMKVEASLSEYIPASMLLNRAVLDNPYPFYARLRETAPVWQVPGTEIFLVTRHALLEEAAGRVEDFSSNMRGVVYRRLNGKPARLTHGGQIGRAHV